MLLKIKRLTVFFGTLVVAATALPASLEAGIVSKELEDDDDFTMNPYGAALSRSIEASGKHGRFLTGTQKDDLDTLMDESILGINHAEEWNEDLFEGDIKLPIPMSRSGLSNEQYRWPNNTLVYQIADGYRPTEKNYINQAFKLIETRTNECIKFRKATEKDKAYLVIRKLSSGCSSELGFQNKVQHTNLSSACFINGYGTAAHELLHVLGIFHEQSRSDRDKWVKIDYTNVVAGKENNFKVVDTEITSEFGLEYDYKSIMHYSRYAFAKNKNVPTISSLVPGKEHGMGQRRELSEGDVKKIRVMYKCDQTER